MWFFSMGKIPSILIRVEFEPLTLAIGLQMVWTGLYLLHPHQLAEVSHQLTLKISALIHYDLFGQPIVDKKLVP